MWKKVKAFLFADIPVSMVHFVVVILAHENGWRDLLGVIGQPGLWLARSLGATGGAPIWWVFMVVNSLVWGGAVACLVTFLRKK